MTVLVDPVRVLFVQANPPGTSWIDTAVEERNLTNALWNSLQRTGFDLSNLSAARIRDLPVNLRRYQPSILHFAVHGDQSGRLTLNASDDQDEQLLRSEDLATILRIYQAETTNPIRLMVLAGCHTMHAASLASEYVACTIGMAGEFTDYAAKDIFTPTFYAALADGRSIRNAVDEAIAALSSHQAPCLRHQYE